MHKMNANKALVLLVISALVAGVGCGSGKSTKRPKKDRPSAANQLANKARVPTPDNGGVNGGGGTNGGDAGTNDEGKGGNGTKVGTDSVERTKKDLAIEAIWLPLVAGTPINTSDFELGTYTFEGTATSIKIMPGNGQWAKAATVNSISGGNFVMMNQEQYGMLPDGASDNGYNVLLPSIFSVEKRAEQPKPNPLSYVLISKFGPLPKTLTTHGLTDRLEDAGTTKPAVSLLDLIAGKTTDISNKKVVLSAWKSSDSTKVRFQLVIDEIPHSSEEDKATQVRTIILTYGFKAKPVETTTAPAAKVDPASATANQPPATAPVEKIGVEIDEK